MPASELHSGAGLGRRSLLDVLDDRSASLDDARPQELPTGFAELDDLLEGGFRRGELTIVGGRPGAGKSILALQWARHAAAAGHPVVFASAESDVHSLAVRLMTLELAELASTDPDVDHTRLERLRLHARRGRGCASVGSDPLLEQARTNVRDYASNLVVACHDGRRMNVASLGATARDSGALALFVDPSAKVGPDDSYAPDRAADSIESLKELAIRESIAVIGTARTTVDPLNAHVGLAELHHADVLAYETDVALMVNPGRSERTALLSIEKNRNGRTRADVVLATDLANLRFTPGDQRD